MTFVHMPAARFFVMVSLLGGIPLLGGCAALRGANTEHLRAEELPRVVVPEGKDASAAGQIYVIPTIKGGVASKEEFEVPRPLPVLQNVFQETVKIQTFEGARWVLINKPPAEIWPRLRNTLTRSGIPAGRVDAAAGLIETGWVTFKDDETNSHRFRFSVEPGIPPNSSEVRILQMQTEAGNEEAAADWPQAVSQDPGREQEMVELIANALASDTNSGAVSLLARKIGGEAKAEVVRPKVADPYIVIRLDFDRAWASVLYALSRGGFSVQDQNQLNGEISVNYLPEGTEKPGFFKRLFGGSGKAGTPYVVLIARLEGGVEVRLAREDKTGLDKEVSAHLLKIIRSNLS